MTDRLNDCITFPVVMVQRLNKEIGNLRAKNERLRRRNKTLHKRIEELEQEVNTLDNIVLELGERD